MSDAEANLLRKCEVDSRLNILLVLLLFWNRLRVVVVVGDHCVLSTSLIVQNNNVATLIRMQLCRRWSHWPLATRCCFLVVGVARAARGICSARRGVLWVQGKFCINARMLGFFFLYGFVENDDHQRRSGIRLTERVFPGEFFAACLFG